MQYAGTDEDLYAIILGAGGSRRFGGLKQLVELDGRSLLRRSIETAIPLFNNRIKVILGNGANKIQQEVDATGAESVINSDWESGIASSLRTGVASLPDDCTGVMIIFCDQVLIKGPHLLALIEQWNNNPSRIIASAYAGTIGVPAIFPASFFRDFSELKGDKGAKSIMQEHQQQLGTVDIPEAEYDIDTQEDLRSLVSR